MQTHKITQDKLPKYPCRWYGFPLLVPWPYQGLVFTIRAQRLLSWDILCFFAIIVLKLENTQFCCYEGFFPSTFTGKIYFFLFVLFHFSVCTKSVLSISTTFSVSDSGYSVLTFKTCLRTILIFFLSVWVCVCLYDLYGFFFGLDN